MGSWVDMNGDGRKDFVTARSNAKKGDGELLWMEHPEDPFNNNGDPWVEHVITKGPDVGIEVDTGFYKDEITVFAAEFFNEKVSVHRVSTKDGTLVQSSIIDDTSILAAYSVQVVDLNSDGQKELLVNNHEKSDKTNGIWAYKMPSDIMTGTYEKYTVASGFHNAFSLTVPNMAPGFPYAIWPETSRQGRERAHVAVAGDGDHTAHLFMPSGDKSQYQYTDEVVKNEGGTVGAMDFADLDNDGWLEMYVPNYDGSYVEVFRLHAPEAEVYLQ